RDVEAVSASDRVAVVAVHGIADQQPGQTVRELARLLCHGGAGEPRHGHGEMHEGLVSGWLLVRDYLMTCRAHPAAADLSGATFGEVLHKISEDKVVQGEEKRIAGVKTVRRG